MAEEKKNAAPDQEFNDDGEPNPDYVKPTEDGGEGGDAAPDNKDGEGDADDSDDEGDKPPEFDDNATPEIPVRSSAASHIIARKNKTIEKLKSKKDEEGTDDYVPPSTDNDTDDGLSPEATTAVDKAVKKQIAPVVEKMAEEADKNELDALFASEPEAKKYEKHIKAYLSHEAYKAVPPSLIYHHLAFANAQVIGAEAKKAADLEADQGKGGGRNLKPKEQSVDGLPTPEEIKNMTDEEIGALGDRAIRGDFAEKK